MSREQWLKFLDLFSRSHEGWIASVEVSGPDGHKAIEVDQRPFSGISLDEKRPHNDRIDVAFGSDDNGNHVLHEVPKVTRLALVSEGSDDLMLQSADGTITILRLLQQRTYTQPRGGKAA